MSGGGLIGEFGAGFLIACLAAVAIGFARDWIFFGTVFLAAVMFLPCTAVVLLASPVHGVVPLAVLLLPVSAWGMRRVRRREWQVARALGGGRWLSFRVVVLPRLAPLLLVALLLGGAVIAGKAWLERRPAGMQQFDDPQVGMG